MPSTQDARAPRPTSRLAALDGLRGIAALVVVLFHVALVSPDLAAVEWTPHLRFDPVSVLAYSPLRLLWSGDEAVVVFFVLSGFVLTVPLRERSADWFSYYPRRALRLYLPVWGSLVLTLVWWFAVPRTAEPGYSWWMSDHQFPLTPRGVAGDATLMFGTTQANSVLWSLRWEVCFSLLLPLYLLALLRWRRLPVAKVLVLAAASEVGQLLSLDWLRWLPVFGLGVVAAAELDRGRAIASGLGRRGGTIALVASLLLLDARWVAGGQLPLAGPTALGALGLVALFAAWKPAGTAGELRPVAWLGRVSFSLYLVHEPVVVSTALVMRTTNPALVAVVALPVSLLLAEAFSRVVELPAKRLSGVVGQRVSIAIQSRRRSVGPTLRPEEGVRGSRSST